jgi:hypothetical protein
MPQSQPTYRCGCGNRQVEHMGYGPVLLSEQPVQRPRLDAITRKTIEQ